MNRCVFLDFDGVLVVASTNFTEADRLCIAHLNEIIERAKAVVVVSSTWRIGRTVEQLQDLLNKWGMKGKVIDKTPVLQQRFGSMVVSQTRGKEIKSWLETNKKAWQDFVILDDDGDMSPLMHKLVQTEFKFGLQREHVEKALALLAVD